MLKAIRWLVKTAVFALVVLVAANYFRLGRKTVSDQVKTQMAHAERADAPRVAHATREAVSELRKWARHVTADRKLKHPKIVARIKKKAATLASSTEEFSSSERKKLRNLMRELNSASASNQ